MFAVAGTWNMDPTMRQEQKLSLPRLVDSVKQNPGFVRGSGLTTWTSRSAASPSSSFETLDRARNFREAVMANAPAQMDAGVERGELQILEVHADA